MKAAVESPSKTERAVSSGLKANDQVVVEGGQKTPVGTEVTVQSADNADSPASGTAATAAAVKEG